MTAFRACLVLLVAVACRGQNESPTAQQSPSPKSAETAPPSDSNSRNALPEAITVPLAADSAAPLAASAEPRAGASARTVNAARTAASNAPPASSSATPPPSKAAEAPARRGAAATGPSYEVWLETTGGYAAGANASIVAVVNAKAPYKCNAQYPYKFALDAPPSGMSYPSSPVRGARVDGKRATMPIPFVAATAGTYAVSGTLSFSTCSEDKCLVDKAHLGVTVDVR